MCDSASFRLCSVPFLLAAIVSCAGPNALARGAPRVRIDALTGPDRAAAAERLSHLPVVLSFAPGDRVPVDFVVNSGLVTVERGDITLVAKRPFYVLLRADGPPVASDDGVEFEARRNHTFQLGLGVHKDAPTEIEVHLGWFVAPVTPAAD